MKGGEEGGSFAKRERDCVLLHLPKGGRKLP